MSSVRAPKDEDEEVRARLLAMMGRGQSVAEVIEQITGETPDDDLVDLVTARLRAASEDDEALDLAAFLREHESWMKEWA